MIDQTWIPLAGMAIPVVIVPVILGIRQESRKREMDHIERMKALETGQPLPTRNAWPAAVVCTAIGAGVPIAAFLFTWLATVSTHVDSEIWFAPAVVSFFSIMTSGKLATKLLRPQQFLDPDATLHAKPRMDPDAYDVVGRRG